MKIIIEKPECESEDVETLEEEEKNGHVDDEEEENNNPLVRDILRYRMLYAQGQDFSSSQSHNRYVKAMWSLLRNIGETLRLLAPAALLAIICGRDSPVIKFLHQFDRALRNALFSSASEVDNILRWLKKSLPGDDRLKSLEAVWVDPTILCDLINSVIPGACSEQHDEETNLIHGQRLVEQYLGVSPIFTEEDIAQKELSHYQECRLSHYLVRIKDAITQMTPPVSRAGTPYLNDQAYTLDYVARGMGIVTAYKGRKASFYIYPTAQQSLEPGDISIQIRGPGTSFGSAVVPVIIGKTHGFRNAILNLDKKQSISHLPPPLVGGTACMRSYDASVQNKYFIPKIKNEIDVKLIFKKDKVKVSYVPNLVGNYEISLISKGCHIIGSPYYIHVDVALAQKHESVDFSDDESCNVGKKPNSKLVYSIVDFVTEKMILTKDGHLEKLSDEDADLLLKPTASSEELTKKFMKIQENLKLLKTPKMQSIERKDGILKFKNSARKLILMLVVCREFKKRATKFIFDTKQIHEHETTWPNAVSTIADKFQPKEILSPINEKIKIDQSNDEFDERKNTAESLRQKFKSGHSSFNMTADKNEDIHNMFEDNFTHDTETTKFRQSTTDIENSHTHFHEHLKKVLKTKASIDIIISSFDDEDALSISESLSSKEELTNLEIVQRPKSPIFKVLESVDDDMDLEKVQDTKRKVEIDGDFSLDFYVNFDENTPEIDTGQNLAIEYDTTDNGRISPSINFHIGEPVTPTRMINTTLEADMDSIILAANLEEALEKYDRQMQKSLKDYNSDDSDSSDFMTPMRQTPFEKMTDSQILKLYEEVEANVESKVHEETMKLCEMGSLHDFNVQKGGVNIKLETQDTLSSNDDERESSYSTFNNSTETWDSAYISIDDINSSSDSNNSPRSDLSPRPKLFSIRETSQENNMTPTWELLNGNKFEENEISRNRIDNEIQKEKEFNEACNESESFFYPKSLRIYNRNISVIEEDDATYNSLPVNLSDSYKRSLNNIDEITKSDSDILRQYRRFDSSASDSSADVNQSANHLELSTVQNVSSELIEEIVSSQHSQVKTYKTLDENEEENIRETNHHNVIKTKLSKLVSEKRDYWDTKINQIQNKENKNASVTRKRNPSIKRNDSLNLNKKRVKQIRAHSETNICRNSSEANDSYTSSANHSLVESWKTYWNDKVANGSKINYHIEQKKKLKYDLNTSDSDDSTDPLEDKGTRKINYGGSSKEIDENSHVATNNRIDAGGNVLGNKYQPTPINLQSVTERIEKFLESLPAPSPVNDVDDVKFSTPEPTKLFGGIVTKHIDKFDINDNKNRLDNRKILKIEQENDKLQIIWNDCQSMKRIEALQQISTSTTPDIYNINANGFAEDIKINEKLISNDVFEKENLTSFPVVSKLKAEVESCKELSPLEARQKFWKHKSKTFDVSKSDKLVPLKKSVSFTKIDNEEYFHNNEMFRTKSISELKKTYEQNISRENINLNVSTESLPSIKNRKLRLEIHLQRKIAHQNKDDINEIEIRNCSKIKTFDSNAPDSEEVKNSQANEKEVFKPIGNIVKAFEKITHPEKDDFVPQVKEELFLNKTKPGRVLETVAEKGEGAKNYIEEETSLLANKSNKMEKYTATSDETSTITKNKESDPTTPIIDLEEIKFEYKDRFNQAKNFFQQLDKQHKERAKTPPKRLNECQMLLMNIENDEKELKNDKGLVMTKPDKPPRKNPIKALSTTVSDTEYEMRRRAWSHSIDSPPRLRKISEKFMVDSLFKDIVGDSNTIGYKFRGIPHKNAVLAAFQSMESVDQLSSYEMTMSQMEDFAKKNGIVNSQTFHTDFPHLPTTEPKKYRSRYDAAASGLINRKDLLKSRKMRRYSEPARPRNLFDFVREP